MERQISNMVKDLALKSVQRFCLKAAVLSLFLFCAWPPQAPWAGEGAEKWVFPATGTVGGIRSSPAVGPDGTVYVGSDDRKIYAISPGGTKKWEFETGAEVSSSPALGYYGGTLTIYVGSEDGKVYAIDPDGNKRWEFETGGVVSSSPAVSSLGIIYVGSEDGKVYAIRSTDGQPEEGSWPFVTGDKVTSSPAVSSDGTVYVGSNDGKLYAIKSTGKEEWVFSASEYPISSSPAIGSDGTVYVGSNDGKVYAIDPDSGEIKNGWPFLTAGEVGGSPAVGPDDVVYVGSADAKFYAINPDGTQKWVFLDAGGPFSSSPAVGLSGTIYAGSDDQRLYAIDSNGAKRWEFLTGGLVSSSPTIGFGGDVYVGSADGKLYAMESGSTRLADTPWPKFRHDARNTGRNNTNVGPSANAGADQTVKSEDTVTLSGSASSDPDYGIPVYSWAQTEGVAVTLSDTTAVRPNFTAPKVEDDPVKLTFELTVTDNQGKTDTDAITVTVEKKDDDSGCFIGILGGK